MIFWSSIYLSHTWLRSSNRYAFRYMSLLERLGVSLHAGQVRWYTTRLNRIFIRLAQCRSRAWNAWFGVGAVFGVALSAVSFVVLITVLYDGMWKHFGHFAFFHSKLNDTSGASSVVSSSSIGGGSSSRQLALSPKSNQLMTPIVPGVNLPFGQIGYYLLTLLICGVLHELGHAVAANCNDIRVNGFGVFLAFIYPGAFVDLNADSLYSARPWQQLKTYCAGVWHNVVIVVIAVVYLRFAWVFLFPLYSTGDGAVVSAVVPGSIISGKRGLRVGDVVTRIADCPVANAEDWRRCLTRQTLSAPHEIPGYCVPVGYILQHRLMPGIRETESKMTNETSDDAFHECCGSNHTAKDLCFSFKSKELISTRGACLPARSVSERPLCHVNSDCLGGRRVKAVDVSKTVCVFPWIGNRTRLLRIARPPTSAVLFLGNPLELRFTARVADYRPRFTFLPINAPTVLELCCKYLASLSGALALLNVVPCYALDGQFILSALVDIFLPSTRFSRSVRSATHNGLRLAGTFLLASNVALAFLNLFLNP